MTSFRELVNSLQALGVDRARPVIAHASLSAFGQLRGGADTLVGALLSVFDSVIMPVFTYRPMITPIVGPPHNAIKYGSGADQNRMAEFFHADMPASRLMGAVAEALRVHPRARRSQHPLLSFAGVNADQYLAAQTIEHPLSPIRRLVEADGWVLLLGVDHSVNTSIHYGEQIAGRRTFIRWALTPIGVQECAAFPGCSQGFTALAPSVKDITRRVQIGPAEAKALPLASLVERVSSRLAREPLAFLCDRRDCERCQAIRATINSSPGVN